eukprot:PhF_6_TR8721/c0_g1_i2/m.13690/K00737/MGAT3; beta-1,4-mannosyl-glycoprotein beta-1,4-N-acetylglucosaminyltransferase
MPPTKKNSYWALVALVIGAFGYSIIQTHNHTTSSTSNTNTNLVRSSYAPPVTSGGDDNPPPLPHVEMKKTPTPPETSENEPAGGGTCSVLDRTMPSVFTPESFDCSKYGLKRRAKIPRLHYGIMIGFESDILEIVLHEIYPVVDSIVITELETTHSKRKKQMLFNTTVQKRKLQRFMDKVTYIPLNPGNKRFKDNWAVEKFQRNSVLYEMTVRKDRIGLQEGDIIMGNIDLDELHSRDLLAKWKVCDVQRPLFFYQLQLKFSFRCMPYNHLAGYGATVFFWEGKPVDLYRARVIIRSKVSLGDTISNSTWVRGGPRSAPELYPLSWHMSSFGSVDDVVRKNENSPHRYVGSYSRKQIEQSIQSCTMFDGVKMNRIWLPNEALPEFVVRNLCHYRSRGWL